MEAKEKLRAEVEERHMASIDSNDRLRSARAHIVEKRRLKSQKAKATAAAKAGRGRGSGGRDVEIAIFAACARRRAKEQGAREGLRGRKEGAGARVVAAPSLTCGPGRLLVVKLRHLHEELVDGRPPTALVGADRDLKSNTEEE